MEIKSEDYTQRKKASKWLNALFKVNLSLEKVIAKLPDLSDNDRKDAMIELDLLMRRASRLEYKFSNELKNENR